MNEVQKALTNWLKLSYQAIDQKVQQEADLFGFRKEQFENGEVELVHKVIEGKIDGCFQVNYGVKKGNHTTAIVTVEFGLNGFTFFGHRKTKIFKAALNGRNGKNLRRI